jgi:ABC-type molybdate transport system substrate-binding protein
MPNRFVAAILGLSLSVAGCSGATRSPPPADTPSPAARAAAVEAQYPPWQHGANNGATNKGIDFTVPPVDVLADFHGSLDNPALVLYVGGNYFFAMAPLVAAFGRAYPAYAGKVYYETIPPGTLVDQMRAGGTITVGNMSWTVKPDVYLAGAEAVRELITEGLVVGPAVTYVSNDLTIMVPAGNPARITGLADLARPDVRLVMPNPKYEGVARQIRAALVKAGGEALATSVYEQKVKDGTAILTRIHHRQTPLFLMQGLADAGVTWTSEALFQEEVGHPISHVAIPDALNATGIYAAALVRDAPHPEAAQAWLRFIRSETALAVFAHYRFKPAL